jgi:hypothetical protein
MFSRSSIALFVLAVLGTGVAVDAYRDEGAGPQVRSGAAPALRGARDLDSRTDLVGRLKRERLRGEVTGDPFAGREPARPSTGASAAPAGPPPFNYRYAGQFRIDDGGWRVYLLKGNDMVLIKVGDMLDGSYKVTAVNAEEFEIVHLPTSTKRVIEYGTLGTGSTFAQGEPSQQAPVASTVSSAPDFPSTRQTPAASSLAGAGAQGPAVMGGPGFAGTAPALAATAGSGSSTSVVTGSVPTGQLGSAGPSASAPRLGVAPAASSSMPMSPAPAGIMQTLPAPTGRLGI